MELTPKMLALGRNCTGSVASPVEGNVLAALRCQDWSFHMVTNWYFI